MRRNIIPYLVSATLCGAFAWSAGAASEGSYSGNWPLTVSHSEFGNGTYCLTLTDDGSYGWPHSGTASLVSQVSGGTQPYGLFQVIDRTLVVTVIQLNGGGGQNNSLVFIAPASDGNILGRGVYDEIAGGETFDSGRLVFGMNGGC